jgi:hypothetical protein
MIAARDLRNLTPSTQAVEIVTLVLVILRGTLVVALASLAPVALVLAWTVDRFDTRITSRRRNPTQLRRNPPLDETVESFSLLRRES